MSIRPLRDRVVVERLEGHGLETVTAGGIIIPATASASVKTKADYFRARVVALGPDAERATEGELAVGDDVLVMTYAADPDKIYTGRATDYGLVIGLDDILCVAEAA